MDCPTPSKEAAVRRTTVTWAVALAEDIERLRASEDQRLQEEADAAARQRQTAVADADQRIADLKAHLGAIPTAPPPNEKPPDPAEAGGFVFGGSIRHAQLQVPLPSLALRLVDAQGKVVLQKSGWAADALGRYRVELGAAEVQAHKGKTLRLEVLDPLGVQVQVSGPLPRIDVGCAEALDLAIPAGANRVVESIALHGAAVKENLARTSALLQDRVRQLELRKAQIGLDLARQGDVALDRKQSLATGKGTLLGMLGR